MTTCPSGHTTQSTDYCDVCGMPIPDTGSAPAPGGGPAPATVSGPSGPSVASGPIGAAPQGLTCPNCAVQNLPDALFCEACGYDFTTGTMPRMPSDEDDTPTNEQPAVGTDGLPISPLDLDAPVVDAPGTGAGENGDGENGATGGDAAGDAGAGDQASGTDAAAAPNGTAVPGPDAPSTPAPPIRPAAEWVAEVWVDPDWYRTQNSPDPLPSPGLPEVVLLSDPSVLVGRVSQSRNIHPQIDCGNDSGVSRRHAQLTTDGRRWWVEDLQSSNGTFVAPASGPLPKDPIDSGDRVELKADDRVYVGGWTRMVIRRATDEEKVAG